MRWNTRCEKLDRSSYEAAMSPLDDAPVPAPVSGTGARIRAAKDRIIRIWESRARRAIGILEHRHRHRVVNSLPEYLEQLADALATGNAGNEMTDRTAAEHGAQRVKLGGYTIPSASSSTSTRSCAPSSSRSWSAINPSTRRTATAFSARSARRFSGPAPSSSASRASRASRSSSRASGPARRPRASSRDRRTGSSASIAPHFDDTAFEVFTKGHDHAEALRTIGILSFLSVPLLARGRILGTLTFGSHDPSRSYGAKDLAFARELAHRTAIAIDNAQLYQQGRRAISLRDEILAIVSHDLRNPLSAILNAVELIKRVQLDRRGAPRVDLGRQRGRPGDHLLVPAAEGRGGERRAGLVTVGHSRSHTRSATIGR